MLSEPAAANEVLGVREILELLPHRYPMLMVDRIDRLEPGVFAEGVKCVTMNEPFFQGHFPGHPIMPGVLIVEAMAQVAGIMLRSRVTLQLVGEDGVARAAARPGMMATISRMRFRRPVVPGDLLCVRASHIKTLGSNHQVQVEARVDSNRVADGELVLVS